MIYYAQRGNKKPFRPRLVLKDTPFSKSQWHGQFFRPDCGLCGLELLRKMNVTQAYQFYIKELERTGHVFIQSGL